MPASASMASDSPASQNTTIAWNTHVGLAKLSARLVTYLSTKAVISTFRFAMKHSSSKACQNLPEELLLMIAHDVREMGWQLESEKWDNLTNSLIRTCEFWRRASQETLLGKRLYGGYQNAESHGSLGVWFPHYEGLSELEPDQQDMEHYYKLQACGDDASMLVKCVEVNLLYQIKKRNKSDKSFEEQVFAQEFSIGLMFLLRRDYSKEAWGSTGWSFDSAHAEVYLTIPTTQRSNESQPDPERVSLHVERYLGPCPAIRTVESPAEDQLQRVRRAAKALSLHVIDETPDAFMYEKPDPDVGTPT